MDNESRQTDFVTGLLNQSPRGPSVHRMLVERLLSLAEDAERAGLRQEASMLATIARSVFDRASS
jgi:hypothetical protein